MVEISFYNPAQNEKYPFSIQPSLLAAHRDDYEHAMVPNWDGSGSIALTTDVLARAEDLINRFGTTDHLVEVTPGRDGSLSFVWDDDCGSYIYLDVGPNDTVHLYSDVMGQPKWEGVSVADDQRILVRLSSAFRGTGWRLRQMAPSLAGAAHGRSGPPARMIDNNNGSSIPWPRWRSASARRHHLPIRLRSPT